LRRRPSVASVALLRGLHGGTVPAMEAVPAMPVEEHQVLDRGIVRQSVYEVELRDGGAAATPFLGVEFSNAHEWPCARLLGD
jgi:hypothetical protein